MNELLEALKGIVQCCDGNEPKHEQIYHIANDAIKEAEAEQLILSGVSHRRELLLFMEHLSTYHGIDEVIDCTKHQHIIEQYEK